MFDLEGKNQRIGQREMYDKFPQHFGCSMEEAVLDSSLTLESYGPTHTIDASRCSHNQHIMLRAPGDIPARIAKRFAQVEGPSKAYMRGCAEELDALFTECVLPHVKVAGRAVSLEDIVVVDCLVYRGGYFPSIHNDTEWDLFQGDGFQLWHLLTNPSEEDGNMFVFECDHLIWTPPDACPVMLFTDEFGASVRFNGVHVPNPLDAEVHRHQGGADPRSRRLPPNYGRFPEVERFMRMRNLNLSPKYVGAREGETFVFGQKLLHMSDPRPKRPRMRHCMNMRVVLREPDGSIKVNLDHGYEFAPLNARLHEKLSALRRSLAASGKMPPSRSIDEKIKEPSVGYLHGVGRYDFV